MICGSLDGRGLWGRMDTCVYMAESLFWPSEIITILSIICVIVVQSPSHVPLCNPMDYSTLGLPVPQSVSSVAQSCLTLCDPMDCSTLASLSTTNFRSLLKLMSIGSVMPSTISSSVTPFSFCLQPFLASGSFPMSQFFASGSHSIGASPSASVLPENIQD